MTRSLTGRRFAALVAIGGLTAGSALSLATAAGGGARGPGLRGIPAPNASAPPVDDSASGPDPTLPAPTASGSVSELLAHRSSGVVSAWLDNGIRVHHMWFAPQAQQSASDIRAATQDAERLTGATVSRIVINTEDAQGKEHTRTTTTGLWGAQTPEHRPRLVVTLTIPGSCAIESSSTYGLSLAAAQALSRPCTRTVAGETISHALESRDVDVKCQARPDALILQFSAGSRQGEMSQDAERICAGQLEVALQAARLLVTEPLVQSDAIEAAIAEEAASRSMARQSARVAVGDALIEIVTPPGDCRFRACRDPAPRPTVELTQAWLDRMLAAPPAADAHPSGRTSVRGGPLEVAIVGQVKLDDAMRLSAKYLGSLPARARVSSSLYHAQRFVPPPQGALVCDRVDAAAGKPPIEQGGVWVDRGAGDAEPGFAAVACGFRGTDTINLRDQRALTLATLALRRRAWVALKPLLPTEDEKGEWCTSWSTPGGGYPPGPGMVVAMAVVREPDADGARTALQGAITGLASAPLKADEFAQAKDSFMSRLRTLLAEPSYWSEVLAACTYRGYRPDDLTAAEETFQNLTADEVQQIWGRYATPERSITVTLRPPK